MDHSAIPFQYSLTVEGEYVVKMRLDPAKVSPAAYHAMLGLESFVNKSSKLEVSLLDLVKMRASQINGCAFSIDMHSKDARVNGALSNQADSFVITYAYTRVAPKDWLRLAGRLDAPLIAMGPWPSTLRPTSYVCGPTIIR